MIEIGGLQKTTLIDYPGRISCTVFLIGCDFRCPWCYSSELVLPEKIKLQPRISEKEFFSFLKERQGLLEGVVVCGGEPTIHKDLPDFIKKIKELGYLVKLDTNGSNPEMLKKLIDEKLIDYIAMDIKQCQKKYDLVTGVKIDFEKIKESINLIKNSGIDYEFRTTVVPTIHNKEDIIQIARDIAPAKRFFLQNFRPEKTIDSKFEKIKPYSKDFLLEIKKEISHFFEICQVRD
jgi:pyruvate formate lyase activating enzyme